MDSDFYYAVGLGIVLYVTYALVKMYLDSKKEKIQICKLKSLGIHYLNI